MSQPSLTPLNSLAHFSILARITSANPLHVAMLMVSSPYCGPLSVGMGPTLLHLHSGLTAQSVTNGVTWTSIHGSPILNWSSHCWNNTTTTRAILGNYASAHGGRAVRPWVKEATPPHSYKLLELLAGALPHRQETFCLSTKSWGQVDIFP